MKIKLIIEECFNIVSFIKSYLDSLLASQQYVTMSLTRYDEDLFSLLYFDVDNSAQSLALEVFQHGRSVSIYGVRGIGKTSLMQGIVWHGLKGANSKKFLPVIVSVTGANSVNSLAELEDKFYRSVLSGLVMSSAIDEKFTRLKARLSEHVPWIASTGITAVALVFPPAVLASKIVEKGTKKLLDKLGITEAEKLLTSREIDPKFAVDFILKELSDENVRPVFVIDELDKVTKDELLSNFFDGQQGWFQGKSSIISLSYNFGQSIEDAVTSVKRFSSVIRFKGVTTPEQFRTIVESRLILGISQIEANESKIRDMTSRIIADEVYEKILNNFVPILHLMLEEIYKSLKKAMMDKRTQVTLQEVIDGKESSIQPTPLEILILDKLAESNKSPTELADLLSKERSTISRRLKSLLTKGWIGRNGKGKNVHYFIKQKGEAMRH